MSNRYGRNQKRAHRARIAELEGQLLVARSKASIYERRALSAEGRALTAESRANAAYERAFERFAASHGLLRAVAERMAEQIGDRLGEELKPHAMRLFEAAKREARRPPFSLSMARSLTDVKINRMRLDVPALGCLYDITDVEMDLSRAG